MPGVGGSFKDGRFYGWVPCWGRMTRGAGPGSFMTPV